MNEVSVSQLRGRIRTLDDRANELSARNLDLMFQVDRDEELLFQQRMRDRRSIWMAMSLLDRALEETIGLRNIRSISTAQGRCWHSRPGCQSLNTATRLFERDACSFCLVALPPYIVHEHTGDTLWQACRTFLDLHGGRVDYMDTII